MLTALYIHIPFCDKVCTYCDFHKEIASLEKQEKYINSLIIELINHQNEYHNLKTIYLGGGTPSSLSISLLKTLFETIKTLINLANIEEYTIETNPNDITLAKARLFKEAGIDRVSIGVQSFNDHHLAFLGRTHHKSDVLTSIKNLREVGITNINIDMMFSLVNQTMEELTEDIQEVTSLPVKHISYYSLILEEKTKLYYLYMQKKISMNDEDTEALMYNKVIDELTKNGFYQYEISNFSKKGNETLHNLVYWKNKEYLGLGSGAHSLYNGKRFSNVRSVMKYTKSIAETNQPLIEEYPVEALREELIMGLRLIEGIDINEINHKYQVDLLTLYPEIYQYLHEKLLKLDENKLSFTRKGLMLGNLVFSIF